MFSKFDLSNIMANDGILISVVGYIVVFVALVLLAVIITYFQKLVQFVSYEKLIYLQKVRHFHR